MSFFSTEVTLRWWRLKTWRQMRWGQIIFVSHTIIEYGGSTCINLWPPCCCSQDGYDSDDFMWERNNGQWADSDLRRLDLLAGCSHAATARSNSAQTFWTSKETFLLVSNTYEGHHRDLLAQAFWFDMLLLNQTKLDDLFHQGFLVIKYIIRTLGIGSGVGLGGVRHV